MKLTIAIPILNQLNDAKSALGLLKYNTSEETEWLIIDNGSTEPVEPFFLRYLKPKRMNYIRNEENVGLVETMKQIYENCSTDILAVTHTDVYIYEKNWDQRIINYFTTIDKLGGVGFFGAQGCGPRGERIQDVPSANIMAGMSNMLEAEQHGMRMQEDYRSVAIFDGFFMSFSMEMLKKHNGFDQRYKYHHFYDRSASLQSLASGYKNIVANVPCHHVSGMTANRSEYQNWIADKLLKDKIEVEKTLSADLHTHDMNMSLFGKIWGEVLPVYVKDDFTYKTETSGQWTFKGDKIVGYDYTK